MLSQLTGLMVAGAVAAGAQGAQQSPPGGGAADSVLVRAVRFFRGDRTLVNGFVRVPHAMLDGIRLGPGGFAVFSVDVSIVDTAGTVLTQDRWTRQVPWASAQLAGAATVDPLTFSVAPGSYHIRVAVRDSASGRRAVSTTRMGASARPLSEWSSSDFPPPGGPTRSSHTGSDSSLFAATVPRIASRARGSGRCSQRW